MATGSKPDQLTRRQIVRLASAISADNMESIAEGYLDISPEALKNIRRDASNSEAFSRDIIRHWAYRNPENQVEVSGPQKPTFYDHYANFFSKNWKHFGCVGLYV